MNSAQELKFGVTPSDMLGSASGIFLLSRKLLIPHPARHEAIDAEVAFLSSPYRAEIGIETGCTSAKSGIIALINPSYGFDFR